MKNEKNILKPILKEDMGAINFMSFDIGYERVLTIIENKFRGGIDISILTSQLFFRDILPESKEEAVLMIDRNSKPLLVNAPYGYFRIDNTQKFPEGNNSIIIDFYGELILKDEELIIKESYKGLSPKEEYLVSKFFEEEYGHNFVYQGERYIHLAYTEDDNGNPIEVILDIKEKHIKRELFLIDETSIVEYFNHYDDDLEEVLSLLDFSSLVRMDYEVEEM